jgi:hypothetical protein
MNIQIFQTFKKYILYILSPNFRQNFRNIFVKIIRQISSSELLCHRKFSGPLELISPPLKVLERSRTEIITSLDTGCITVMIQTLIDLDLIAYCEKNLETDCN